MSTIKVKVTDESRKLKAKLKAGAIKGLSHAAGAVALTAKRSIRRSPKPSKAGTPPHTRAGKMKRLIRFDVDKAAQDAMIGAVPGVPAATIWDLHERGGIGHARTRRLKQKRFEVGQHGPIRIASSGKLVRIVLRTQPQADRAAHVVDDAQQTRDALARVDKKYPPRPFMRPALEKIRPRLPESWAGAVSN